MSAPENIEVVQAYLADHDAKYMVDDAKFFDFSQPEPLQGPEAIGAMLTLFYQTAFSEARAETRNLLADDERVVLEFTFHGVHTGDFFGTAPTGNRVEVPMCVVYDVRDGAIHEGRLYYDSALMSRQLGLIE